MKTLFGLLIMLLSTGFVWAQPFEVSFNTVDPITNELAPVDSVCGDSIHPIADGTTVEIWWDRGSPGPSLEDIIAPLDIFNFSTFVFNGESSVGDPWGRGNFFSNYFQSIGTFPDPARFYVFMCIPPRHFYSRSVTFAAGQTGDVLFGRRDWTCIDSACHPAQWPSAVSRFSASDSATCQGVRLSWEWTDIPTLVDLFRIYRNDDLIKTVDVSVRNYIDSSASGGRRYPYSIVSLNICGLVSAPIFDWGSVYPTPQAPINVIASDDLCGLVRMNWSYLSSAGIDSFIIYRNGIRIGEVGNSGPPQARSFEYYTTSTDSAFYTVGSWNPVCGGLGSVSAGAWGRARQVPEMVSFTVSQGLPDSTVISWTAIEGAMSYTVYRSDSNGTNEAHWAVAATALNYVDRTGLARAEYRYRVAANNSCGSGAMAPYQTGWHDLGIGAEPTGSNLPQDYSLSQNYPNPFNPTTHITFTLPQTVHVSLTVRDVLGRQAAILVNETLSAGAHSVSLDGSSLPAGLYFYQLKSAEFVQTRKMVLLK